MLGAERHDHALAGGARAHRLPRVRPRAARACSQPGADPVRKVSIVPARPGARRDLPEPGRRTATATATTTCAGRIVGALGGRAAEEIVYGEHDHRRRVRPRAGHPHRPPDGRPLGHVRGQSARSPCCPGRATSRCSSRAPATASPSAPASWSTPRSGASSTSATSEAGRPPARQPRQARRAWPGPAGARDAGRGRRLPHRRGPAPPRESPPSPPQAEGHHGPRGARPESDGRVTCPSGASARRAPGRPGTREQKVSRSRRRPGGRPPRCRPGRRSARGPDARSRPGRDRRRPERARLRGCLGAEGAAGGAPPVRAVATTATTPPRRRPGRGPARPAAPLDRGTRAAAGRRRRGAQRVPDPRPDGVGRRGVSARRPRPAPRAPARRPSRGSAPAVSSRPRRSGPGLPVAVMARSTSPLSLVRARCSRVDTASATLRQGRGLGRVEAQHDPQGDDLALLRTSGRARAARWPATALRARRAAAPTASRAAA